MTQDSSSEWLCHFLTAHPIPDLPRLVNVACETRLSHSYHFRGVDRREAHVVFQYTLAGEGRFRYGDRSYPLPPGTGFLCCVSDPQMSYYLPAESSMWQFVWANLSGNHAIRAVDEYVSRHGHLVNLRLDHPIIKWMQSCQQLDDSPRLAPLQGARLVFDILAAIEGAMQPREQTRRQLLERATAIIHERALTGLTVNELAESLDVSREHLSRAFSLELGLSPHAYITRQRLLHACQLLSTTNLTVKEIAYSCGYPSTAQFTRSFKRVVQMTPSDFRAGGHSPLF